MTAEPEHDYAPHLDLYGACLCANPCCMTEPNGECVCPECSGNSCTGHEDRREARS